MKRSLTLALLLLITLSMGWSQGWKRTFGGQTAFDCQKVLQTNDDGYFLVGSREVGSGISESVHIVRLDLDGNELWSQTYQQGWEDKAFDALLTADGGLFIAGQTRERPTSDINAFLLKINPFGETQWFKTYGDELDNNAVSITAAENTLALAGYATNAETEARNFYLIKTDLEGELIFDKQLGGLDEEEARDIIAVEDGYLLAGYIEYVSSSKQRDMYVVKVDENGELRWSRALGGFEYEDAKAIAQTSDGNFIVAGNKGVTEDFCAFSLNADGVEQWERQYELDFEQVCTDVFSNEDGTIILGGSTIDEDGINIDLAILKVSAEGNLIWSRQYGDEEWKDEASSIIATSDGGYAIAGSSDLLNVSNNSINNFIIVKTDELGNVNSNRIEGRIFYDVADDCTWVSEQDIPFKDWIVKIESRTAGREEIYYTATDENGNYAVTTGTGTYRVSVLNQNENYWTPCVNDLTRVFTTTYDTLRAVDFPIKADLFCPYVEVDISAPSLAGCSDVNYTVSYCNVGSAPASDVIVEVELDDLISLDNAQITPTQIDPNTYAFNIGNLSIGECGSFTINASLACEGFITGQSHKVTAKVDTTFACFTPDEEWDEASLDVDGTCKEAENIVEFQLSNIGRGDMEATTNFTVVQADVILFSAPIQLPADRDTLLELPARGTTYRIIAEQTSGHPGRSFPTVAVEGCGTDEGGNVIVGDVTQFPEDDADPFIAIDVQENTDATGTFLRGFPKGYRADRFIESGKDITYHLQFQNMSNDLVRHVVIRDTLPEGLDLASVLPGASSHPYEFEVYGGRILKFTFDKVAIPSINEDEAGSKGFVKFRVRQQPNLEAGTVITNRASVALNFQKPFDTNDVFHTIGGELLDFAEVVITSTEEEEFEGVSVTAAPNPFTEFTLLMLEGWQGEAADFQLFDVQGKLIRQVPFNYNKVLLEKRNLATGLYFYRVTAEGQLLDAGKIVVE